MTVTINFLVQHFQLHVDKNCNATPNPPQQVQQTSPPVNQTISASLTTNAVRQGAEHTNPNPHYINMHKQNQGLINSGAANKV